MSRSGFAFEGSGRIDRIDTFTTKKGGEIITLVLQVEGAYPQLVPIKFFGRMADAANEFSVGDFVEITGRLGGREWNGKVYGDIVGESIELVAADGAGQHRDEHCPSKSAQPEQEQSSDDSIPF